VVGFDSIIFDLDGTLWDTTHACAKAWSFAFRELGLPDQRILPSDIASCMGQTSEEIRLRLFPRVPRSQGQNIMKECFRHEVSFIREEGAQIYPGVPEGLESLSHHYPLYIVSNCDKPYLETFLEITTLGRFFKDSECHGGTGLRKGENILDVMQRNGLRSPIYIGDTVSDQTSADFAGIPFAFVEYGFGRCKNPRISFRRFAHLVSWLLYLAGAEQPWDPHLNDAPGLEV
jgi:phosphoglycolate phosphatase